MAHVIYADVAKLPAVPVARHNGIAITAVWLQPFVNFRSEAPCCECIRLLDSELAL